MRKLLLLGVVLILFGCKKKEAVLLACFETNKDYYTINEEISFNDCSVNAENIEWSFGDNDDSNFRNPKHYYENFGEFEVQQTVYDELNNFETLSKNIEIKKLKLDSIIAFTDNIELIKTTIIEEVQQKNIFYYHYPMNDNISANGGKIILPNNNLNANNIIQNDFMKVSITSENDKIFFIENLYKLIDMDTYSMELEIDDNKITFYFSLED